MQSMIQSAARFQLQALDDGLLIDSPLLKSKPSDAAHLRRLLEMTIRVAPLVVPDDAAMTAPVLNHPDLSLDNILVPPEGDASMTCVVDWQGATVLPYCSQTGLRGR